MSATDPSALPQAVQALRAELVNLEARLDGRLDDQANANQLRAGAQEEALIRVEAAVGALRGDVGGVKREVSSLRLFLNDRFDTLQGGMDRTTRMLEILLRERGREVPT